MGLRYKKFHLNQSFYEMAISTKTRSMQLKPGADLESATPKLAPTCGSPHHTGATRPSTGLSPSVGLHHELIRYFLNRARHPEDARDLAQQVQMRLLGRPLDRMENPRGYIFRTAANVLTDYINKRKSSRVEFDSAKVDVAAAKNEDYWHDPLYEQEEARQIAHQALSTLPESVRTVFRQACIEGLPVPQIAEKLGMSEHTVVTYRARAIRKLKAYSKDS
jgi:RNA polymerase sigma-70 factor (ECF subfamily)